MLLRLSSGTRIGVSPFFFWESRHTGLLRIRGGGVFHPAHVTTRLCLELLESSRPSHPWQSLLDVGCGSGILGLAGAWLGVPLVVGLDIDPRAVRISRENARANRLDQHSHWFIGTLSAVRCRFDCVVANLPYEVILGVLDQALECLAPGGRLILSGFQDIQWHAVADRLHSNGMQILDTRSGDLSFYGVPPSGSFTWMAVLAG
jgi:ribosomal protein L11 methyltransferase